MRIKNYLYDKQNGLCHITYYTPYGDVSGAALVSPEDADDGLTSEAIGSALATRRAMAEYYQRKSNSLHYKYLGAKAVLDATVGEMEDSRMNVVNNYHKQWKDARKKYEELSNPKNQQEFAIQMLKKKKDFRENGDRILAQARQSLKDTIDSALEDGMPDE